MVRRGLWLAKGQSGPSQSGRSKAVGQDRKAGDFAVTFKALGANSLGGVPVQADVTRCVAAIVGWESVGCNGDRSKYAIILNTLSRAGGLTWQLRNNGHVLIASVS